MKAFLTKDKKNRQVSVAVTVDDVSDLVDHVMFRQMTEIIAEKFVEEYFMDIIKKVDAKTLAAFITVEAAKQAVNGRP